MDFLHVIQELLKSKIIIVFAAFGALFAFLLGIFSRVDFIMLLFRSLLGGIIFGALGAALHIFLQKSLSPEDYQALMGEKSGESSGQALAENRKPRVNVVDDSEISAASLYRHDSLETSDSLSDEGTSQETPVMKPETGGAGNAGGFQEMQFGGISGGPEESGQTSDYGIDHPMESKNSSPTAVIQDDIRKIQESVHDSSNGEVRFKAGGKMINTDPKIVARAIQTILRKDS